MALRKDELLAEVLDARARAREASIHIEAALEVGAEVDRTVLENFIQAYADLDTLLWGIP